MLRQQQHDAEATSILHNYYIGQQFNGVRQFKYIFQRVLFALLALQDNKEQAKMAGIGGK